MLSFTRFRYINLPNIVNDFDHIFSRCEAQTNKRKCIFWQLFNSFYGFFLLWDQVQVGLVNRGASSNRKLKIAGKTVWITPKNISLNLFLLVILNVDFHDIFRRKRVNLFKQLLQLDISINFSRRKVKTT